MLASLHWMSTSARSRLGMVGVRLLVVALAVSAPLAPGVAQDHIRVDGTVLWVSGNTLTLALDGPVSPGYTIVGPYLVPVAGQRPTVNVDLTRIPQSDYAFMRPGERVGIIGAVSSDARRLIGTSIIRDAGQQAP
jgi:hypothetical protein